MHGYGTNNNLLACSRKVVREIYVVPYKQHSRTDGVDNTAVLYGLGFGPWSGKWLFSLPQPLLTRSGAHLTSSNGYRLCFWR